MKPTHLKDILDDEKSHYKIRFKNLTPLDHLDVSRHALKISFYSVILVP